MQHISDDDLERYYLGMIPKGLEVTAAEEHLLWCAAGKRDYSVRLNGSHRQWEKDPPKEVVG